MLIIAIVPLPPPPFFFVIRTNYWQTCCPVAEGLVSTYVGAFEKLWKGTVSFVLSVCVGWNSVVSIATCYRLDGLGIESQWGQYFPHLSRPAVGPTQPPRQWVPGLSRGKAARAWYWPPPHLAPRLKKEYSCTLSLLLGPHWLLQGKLCLYFYHIYLSICMEQHGSHWLYCCEIWYLCIFLEICWENSSLL